MTRQPAPKPLPLALAEAAGWLGFGAGLVAALIEETWKWVFIAMIGLFCWQAAVNTVTSWQKASKVIRLTEDEGRRHRSKIERKDD